MNADIIIAMVCFLIVAPIIGASNLKLHFDTANLKMKPNKNCTVKSDGLLRKWEEHLEGTMDFGEYICTGMIYYYDEKEREHWIDIIENIIINRKTVPSGTTLTVFYNPKNPNESYVQIKDEYVKSANCIFYSMISRMVCVTVAVFAFAFYIAKRPSSIISFFFSETGIPNWDQISPISFIIVTLAVALYLDVFINIILLNVDRMVLRLKFKNDCTVKVNGTLKRWEEHKLFNEKFIRPKISVIHIAVVSYKDENGKNWTVNVQEKNDFFRNNVKIGSKIPIFINPNNKVDACIDYKALLKQKSKLK